MILGWPVEAWLIFLSSVTLASLFLLRPIRFFATVEYLVDPPLSASGPDRASKEQVAAANGVMPLLADLGFGPAEWVRFERYSTIHSLECTLMRHAETGTVATVASLFVHNLGRRRFFCNWVGFGTSFSDGFSLTTLNCRLLLMINAGRNKRMVDVPSVQDPVELFEIHRWMLRKEMAAHELDDAGTQEPLGERMRASLGNAILALAERGILHLGSEAPPAYVFTVYGAYHACWTAELWPFTSIRRFLRARRERRILEEWRRERPASST